MMVYVLTLIQLLFAIQTSISGLKSTNKLTCVLKYIDIGQ